MTEPLPLSYRSLGDEVEDGPLYEVKGGDRHQGFSWNEEPEIWEGQGIYSCKGIVAEEIGAYLSAQQTEQIVSFESSQLGRCCLKLGRWKGALAYGYLTSDSGFHGALLGSCHDEPVLYRSFGNLKDIGESDLQILLDRVWPSKRDKDNGGVTPCYENHSPSAQIIWSVLPGRRIEEEKTFQEGDGRQMHIEWGQCEGLSYLYWANTYDQRQLVLMENSRAHLLKEYYSESLTSVKDSPPSSSQ
jgi:hypothetical protein